VDRDEEFKEWFSELSPPLGAEWYAKHTWDHWWPVVEHIEKAMRSLETWDIQNVRADAAHTELNAALEVVRGR